MTSSSVELVIGKNKASTAACAACLAGARARFLPFRRNRDQNFRLRGRRTILFADRDHRIPREELDVCLGLIGRSLRQLDAAAHATECAA